jgi:sterol desaturase/sphingolipid hydroxylase (fatty acid hydroxylase superfamily)
MDSGFWAVVAEHYQWQLSLYAALGILAATVVGGWLLRLVPAIAEASRINRETFRAKMEKPNYAANQKRNRKWGLIFQVAIFGLILPFCLTPTVPAWWKVLLDVFVILMVYDFVYYLTHRFLFHDSAFFGGPLKWMHAIHHRQHNPCRNDSSYIHPLEIAIGLGLYVGTIALLASLMGRFDVVTIVVTFVAFSHINLHNHNLWTADGFGFRYLNYASRMHHNHHARFTGGNYATITLLYDWMFGTLDHGEGYGKKPARRGQAASFSTHSG